MVLSCSVCGRWLNTRSGKGSHSLCNKCSPYTNEPSTTIEPTFLLTSEISEKNMNLRLKEGFALLQGY